MHSDEEETRREVAFLRAMAAYRRYKLLARLAYPAALVTAVAFGVALCRACMG